MPWILAPRVSTLRSLVEDLFAKRGSSPVIRVEADNEAVMRSLVTAGGGVALMREDLAVEAAAAGEIALWNDVRLTTTLKFLFLRQREDDPVIRALRDVLHGIWSSMPASAGKAA
jgi:DNA-binding transcriptional LysR family regulator